MTTLQLAVLVAGGASVALLAGQFLRMKAFGTRVLFAKSAGSPSAGARYAFTKGMLPWSKESVMMNMPSYLAGIVYHTGVFTAFGLLAFNLAGIEIQPLIVWPGRILTLMGALGGLVLLIKRVVKPHLRGLSYPDDYVANLLTTTFPALACLSSFVPAVQPIWLAESIILLIYVPFGKIRHCVFFFSTRYHFGAFFGRRGTFPPAA